MCSILEMGTAVKNSLFEGRKITVQYMNRGLENQTYSPYSGIQAGNREVISGIFSELSIPICEQTYFRMAGFVHVDTAHIPDRDCNLIVW